MSPKRLIERFYHEVWNRADEVVAREILHPEFCFRGSLGEEKRGPDGFITYLRMILTRLYAWIRLFGLYYGDSGIFVRRTAYEALGGFLPIALMEDLEFVRRLERLRRTCCIKNPPLITSSRRFAGRRPRQMLFVWIRLHVLFWRGVSPDRLAEFYKTQAPRPQ